MVELQNEDIFFIEEGRKKRFWKQVNRPFDVLHDCGSLVDGRLETKTPPR